LVRLFQIPAVAEYPDPDRQLFFLWLVEHPLHGLIGAQHPPGLSVRLPGGITQQEKGKAFLMAEHHQ
jgi:hypothetical protein